MWNDEKTKTPDSEEMTPRILGIFPNDSSFEFRQFNSFVSIRVHSCLISLRVQ